MEKYQCLIPSLCEKYKVRSETSERYQSFLLMINSKDSRETKKCKGGCYTPLPRRTLSCSTSLPVISSSFCFVFLSPCRNIIPPHLVSLLSLFTFALSLHCHSRSSFHFLLYLHFPSSHLFLRVRVRGCVCVCVLLVTRRGEDDAGVRASVYVVDSNAGWMC
ncbi:hypothetical protein BKA57DRAFT_463023 [Linnemannia elongata]|nr:hypothetical protein BKA57DRAFT_463023 [Linnemannia elongata]